MESALLEDNPHWFDSSVYDSYVNREILKKAMLFLDAKEVLAIIGRGELGKALF